MKKVLIYSTTGSNGKIVETEATEWAGLQTSLLAAGVSFEGMKAILDSRVTLESSRAQLPTGDFTLFLMPLKTKSGLQMIDIEGLSYYQCRAMVRDIITNADNKEAAKLHFTVNGKNYTQTSTINMKINLKKWFENLGGKKANPQPKKVSKPVIEEKVEAKVIKEVPEIPFEKVTKSNTSLSLGAKVLNVINSIVNYFFDNVLNTSETDELTSILESANLLNDRIETRFLKEIEEKAVEEKRKEEAIKAEKIRLDAINKIEAEAKEKIDKLNSEASELSREFNDINDIY
jgi:hypothetical protein